MANKKDNNSTSLKEVKPSDEKVEINKSDLDLVFKKLEDQGKTIELLVKAADKGRFNKAVGEGKSNVLIRTARVSKFKDNGQLILGWKLTSNVSEIVNGRWVEDQKTMLIFEDTTTKEIPLLDFYRKIEPVEGEIVSRTQKMDNNGESEEILTISFADGKKVELSSRFVNQT